jgi:hypothetical protein
MSTATMLQSGALHLPQARPRPTHKAHPALPRRTGKGALLGPLQALVEARMRKAEIEMEFRRHSCATASASAGKEEPTHFAALCSRAAARLSSLASLASGMRQRRGLHERPGTDRRSPAPF